MNMRVKLSVFITIPDTVISSSQSQELNNVMIETNNITLNKIDFFMIFFYFF